ncbi:hypothetical protein [Paenibacillus xylanexedens]|uniref:hypothetical protein n=1 Tax=Paenibacillus xylanexedens TaxID=528191 RepID=UPI0011A9F79F|nr:hypothetical protein [Paenibacillus xylanexedens]
MKEWMGGLNVVEGGGRGEGGRVGDGGRRIVMDVGMIGESGRKDIIAVMEYGIEEKQVGAWARVKQLYAVVAQTYKCTW